MLDRRKFLKLSAAALTSSYIAPYANLYAKINTAKYLILVELNGGNDGLNTIVPFRDKRYMQLRPRIGLKESEIIPLTDQLAMHKALEPLHSIWKDQQLAVVNGVGYENPNRSHFRSIEIWDTASDSEEYIDTGWLSRIIPNQVEHGDYLVDGIVIGRNAAPASGNNMRTIVMNTIADFTQQAKLIEERKKTTKNPALAHVLSVQSDIKYAATKMEKTMHSKALKIENFNAGPFGRQLQEAARLIINGTAAPVIKVSIGSFDTHAAQKGVHQRLLGHFSKGLLSFSKVMKKHNLWDDVLIMSYSEFGRRASENANQGTDHGTAAPHFYLGGKVNGGMYGKQPSLQYLQNQDLQFSVDYRCLYNTVAANWWGSSARVGHNRFSPIQGLLKT